MQSPKSSFERVTGLLSLSEQGCRARALTGSEPTLLTGHGGFQRADGDVDCTWC